MPKYSGLLRVGVVGIGVHTSVMLRIVLFLEFQLPVVVLVHVLQPVLGVLFYGFVVFLRQDCYDVVFFLLFLVDVALVYHLEKYDEYDK